MVNPNINPNNREISKDILAFIITLAIFLGLLFFGFLYGCTKTNVAKTIPVTNQQIVNKETVRPTVKMWPDYIEIKAEIKDDNGISYRASYQYFKETRELRVVAKLSLEPIDTSEKLPSEIYIDESGKIVEVKIWGVGKYECLPNYNEMSGSLCKTAEDKYNYFCSAERMNCKTIIEEILLKEPGEWL